VKSAPIKEVIENLQKKYLEKKCHTMKKLTGTETSANKISVWNEAQYLKWRSQKY
jgi:hypothetical protein